jgi:PilZ domain-containing protein
MAHNQGPTGHAVRVPRHHRQPVRMKATLHAYSGSHRVEIIDYSPHGLGLERVSGIQPQERLTVELPSGLRLPMMVLWLEDGRAGLRFLGPIAPGHTVMRLLEEAARSYKRRHPCPTSA